MTGRLTVATGETIAGRYVIVSEIGRGGMGSVYEAFDSKLERSVALKFLDPRLQEHPEAVSRFQREALAAGRIGHENICDVRDRGETSEGTPYIVMERLEGQPLSHIIKPGERLEPERICRLLVQALSALGAAHKARIVHRDLKPENIFVTIDSEGRERSKILDFGISKFLTESVGDRLTRTGTVMGSPLYMSPEQGRGRTDIDDRTDLWSVGVILYEALSGQVPFDGMNYNEIIVNIVTNEPREIRMLVPDIDEQLEAVVTKALAKRRADRFQTAQDFADAIRAAMEGKLDPSSLIAARPPAPLDDEDGSPERRVIITDRDAEVDGATVAAFAEIEDDADDDRRPSSTPTVAPGGAEPTREQDPEPEAESGARRSWLVPIVIVALLAVAGVGAAVALTGGDSGDETETTPGEAQQRGTSPTVAGGGAAAAERDAGTAAPPDAAVASAPAPVGVKLLGVPEGANVTFDGKTVGSSVFEAVPGHTGVLAVSVAGHEPLQLDVLVAENTVVDVGHKLRRVRDDERESGGGRSRHGDARRGTKVADQPSEPPPTSAGGGRDRTVKGRFGTRLDIEYPGAGTNSTKTPSSTGGRRVIKGAHGTRVSTDYPE